MWLYVSPSIDLNFFHSISARKFEYFIKFRHTSHHSNKKALIYSHLCSILFAQQKIQINTRTICGKYKY